VSHPDTADHVSADETAGNDSRASVAAALLLELRTPLARVTLAASQLARSASSPASHGLAASIADAVSQIDAGIERVLPLLVNLPPRPAALEAIDVVLPAVLERLGPGIAAREVSLALETQQAGGARCDPHTARRAAAALLQVGTAWLGRGGDARLSVARESERVGLRIECVGGDASARDERAFPSLESRCSGEADVEHTVSAEAACATLWLRGVETCAAS